MDSQRRLRSAIIRTAPNGSRLSQCNYDLSVFSCLIIKLLLCWIWSMYCFMGPELNKRDTNRYDKRVEEACFLTAD